MEATRHEFTAADGVRLSWAEMGEGEARPVVLLHGLFSDAETNWLKFGHAAQIAARGLRVIMPDLRAHGMSDKPHDQASYPPDTYGRLVAAKDRYDPTNLFHLNQNIRPSRPTRR